MFLRASGFTSGAQASSRSRKTWSAGRPLAFSRNRGLLPGTARQERRGRRVSVTGCMVPRSLRRDQARVGGLTTRDGRIDRGPGATVIGRLTFCRDVREPSMTTAGRVFLARLAGIAVYDPGG